MTANESSNKPNQIKLNNVIYNVEKVVTNAQHLAEGRPNVVRHRNKVGIVADMILRRPKGQKLHLAYVYANGQTQYVVGL